MNLKKILLYVGIGVLAFMLYKVIFGTAKPTTFNPYTEQAEPAKVEEPVKSATTQPVVLTKDQELINEYTSKIVAGQTEGGNVYYQRGIVFLRAGQPQAAVQDFNITLKMVPNSPFVFYNRALAYMQLHDYEKAVADLSSAIKAKPDFMDAYNTRGLAYVEMEYYNDAINDYAAALKIDTTFPDVYFNQGTLYMRLKKYTEAKDSFAKAISNSRAPANATPEQLDQMQTKLMQAYLNLARAELMLNDYEAALKSATYVVDNAPKNVDALRVRAEIYERSGNSAAAAVDTAAADTLKMQQMLESKR